MSDRPSIKEMWTTQATEGFSMSLAEIRARSAKFERRVRIRNLIEYLAAAVVVPSFGWYVWVLPGLLTKIGSLLIIVGVLVVSWQLHKRGSARKPPLAGTFVEYIAYLRGELVRQRDALKSVPLWYLGPFAPGMALFIAGISIAQHSMATAAAMSGLVAVLFTAVWLLNRWAAAKLQKNVEALDRLNKSNSWGKHA